MKALISKEEELRRSKRLALSLLAVALAIFIATSLLPRGLGFDFWIDGVRAVSEAAVVGALADWFAVVALFRKVPIPFISRHTSIIPNNKNRIADNLAAFVEDKFLKPEALAEVILHNDPATAVARWLALPENRRLLSSYLVKLLPEMLAMADDASVQKLLRDALNAAVNKLELSPALGGLLDGLTRDGRHQELLDDGIAALITIMNKPASRELIAGLIADWLKREHKAMQLMLPTAWLSESGAAMIANTLANIMQNIAGDKEHKLRAGFDEMVRRFVERLRSDPAFIAKGEDLKRYLRDGDAFNNYIKTLWSSVRTWIKADIETEQSRLNDGAIKAAGWLSEELLAHPAMRASLNEHMAAMAHTLAPAFARFLTRHISDTVKAWDERDMSRQIELNIGKDLQYIRINGTIVGGMIGVVLYLLSQLPALLR